MGLGNPGDRYAGTRHNAGAEVVFGIARRLAINLTHHSFNSQWGRGKTGAGEVVLAFPLTFMNLSGQAVAALSRYYNIEPENLLIVSDDLHLPFGQLRFRARGSAGGHNGLKSVFECLGTQEISRLRVGIGEAPAGWDPADYVLARFTSEEQSLLPPLLEKAVDAAQAWLDQGLPHAMRQYNGSVPASDIKEASA